MTNSLKCDEFGCARLTPSSADTLSFVFIIAAELRIAKFSNPAGPRRAICIAPINAINVSLEQMLDVALCLLICCSLVESVRVNAL